LIPGLEFLESPKRKQRGFFIAECVFFPGEVQVNAACEMNCWQIAYVWDFLWLEEVWITLGYYVCK